MNKRIGIALALFVVLGVFLGCDQTKPPALNDTSKDAGSVQKEARKAQFKMPGVK